MNNYRNYGNYGNRRYAGGMDDCGCMGSNSVRMMQNKANMKSEKDCGCVKAEEMSRMECGCGMKDEKDCDCKEGKDADKCGCTIESMYREVKKNGMCYEEDMPGKALAMAYVPWQTWRKLYEVCEGFSTGTIFKELDLEFYGRRCN